jgi:hypothetical protein
MGFAWFQTSLETDKKAEAKALEDATLTPWQREAAQKLAAFEQAEAKRRQREAAIAYACKQLVKKSLHDPDSAKFEDGFFYWPDKGFDRLEVQVRARNAFNAMRLSTFECRVRSKDGALVSIRELNR